MEIRYTMEGNGGIRDTSSRKTKDEHYRKKDCDLDQHLDFVVAFAKTKNWFYTMSVAGNYWNDEHMDVIFYHLRKKSKFQSNGNPKYTTAMCHFKSLMDEIYHTYKAQVPGQNALTQENSICSHIKGFGTPTGIPWDQIDDVYISVNCKEEFHWVLAVIQLKDRDCVLYSAAYAEYLTDGQPIPLANFEANLHHSRYGALLWNYGNQKASFDSDSDNEDPPKPRNTFVDSDDIEKINID
ncbi:hypothetical protein KY290_018684 [Solanum tuberosum]|uniref:Ulp1 protease family, C-terminal catalytic domain containing protein n=1 Tax=Solanum tuberosum TaxID=4113 RepID=A0ABQ7VF00_SOLTU|nr:hypothetical protein KY290_018684 [Solanum tuberosum]